MLYTNLMPKMCGLPVAEAFIKNFRKLVSFNKDKYIPVANIQEIEFFNAWTQNFELIDNDSYCALFEIFNELIKSVLTI